METVLKIIWIIIILTAFSAQGICVQGGQEILIAASDNDNAGSGGKSEQRDALLNFTFDGKPVHPGCVKEFDASLADSPPPIVRALDVKACVTSNEFYMQFKKNDDGYVGYEYGLGEGEKGSFSYKYLGSSDS